jgi:hypothetical protein
MFRKLALLSIISIIFLYFSPRIVKAGLYDNNDDMIQVDKVEGKETGDMMGSDVVKPVPKPTKAAEPTATPKPKPSVKPKAAAKAKVKKAPTPKPTATSTPTPVPTVAKYPDFQVSGLTVEEVVLDKNSANYYGMLPVMTGEKKLKVTMIIENTGEESAPATSAELKATHPRILVNDPLKDLQTILKGEKREVSFDIQRVAGYDGPENLQFTLKVKSGITEKNFPLEVYAEPFNPLAVYAVIGGILLLIIIIIVLSIRSGGGRRKKKQDFEFE